MPVHDDLGTRMKTYYEQIPKTKLMRRCPVAVRIDGRSFHTWTRGFKRPFDEVLIASMQDMMKYLCENISGCVIGYCQSDECTLILVDYQKLESEAFFNYEVQKMCSVIASMATMSFNRAFSNNVQAFGYDCCYDSENDNYGDKAVEGKEDDYNRYSSIYINRIGTAMFDARCFNIPKEEVTNLIYWRQLDASRNSIQMVGQAYFSHKELQNKSCNDIQDMLMTQKGINWNDFPAYQKRGSCCVRNKIVIEENGNKVIATLRDFKQPENAWIVDTEIPIFVEMIENILIG